MWRNHNYIVNLFDIQLGARIILNANAVVISVIGLYDPGKALFTNYFINYLIIQKGASKYARYLNLWGCSSVYYEVMISFVLLKLVFGPLNIVPQPSLVVFGINLVLMVVILQQIETWTKLLYLFLCS